MSSRSCVGNLMSVFTRLKPLYQDVLHDMGDFEECLIDGESLFLEAVLDVRCPAAFSGAPLQLIYYVEKFFTKLHGHGSRFRIVFFDVYALIWSFIPEVASLRETLIAHLRRTLPPHAMRLFPSWWRMSPQPQKKGGSDPNPEMKARLPPTPGRESTDDGDGLNGQGQNTFPRLLTSMRPTFVLVSSLLSELPKLYCKRSLKRPAAGGASPAAEAAAGPSEIPSAAAAPMAPAVCRDVRDGDDGGDALHDSDKCRWRLLESPELQLVAQLSMALLLYCLHSTAVVLSSSLDLDASTRPFGFILEPNTSRHVLRGGQRLLRAAMHNMLYENPLLHDAAVRMVKRRSELADGDAVAQRAMKFLAHQKDVPPGEGLPVLTPHAALAASVCSVLLRGADGAGGDRGSGDSTHADNASNGGNGDPVPLLWLCEAYLLHAVLLDWLPLERRALALPYGCLRGLYGFSPSRPSQGCDTAAACARDGEDTPTAQLSALMQRFMKDRLLPLMAAAVQSDAWEVAAATGADRVAGSGSDVDPSHVYDSVSPSPLPSPASLPAVRAVLADPYQGSLLQALVIALLILRSDTRRQPQSPQQQQQEQVQEEMQQQQQQVQPVQVSVRAALLGLPPASLTIWQAARQLAGLMAVPSPQQGGDEEPTAAEMLVRHLLDSMPYSDADAHAATVLRSLLLGSAATGGWSDDQGFPERLDRRAQEALQEVFRLPEPLRQNPVVQAIDQLWQRIAPAPAIAGSAAAAGSAGAEGARTRSRAAVAAMAAAGSCGPWEPLLTAVLQDDSSDRCADGGFDEAGVMEIYHWHTRQPLQPAFLTQASSGEVTMRQVLKQLRQKPADLLLQLFGRFMSRKDRWRVKKASLDTEKRLLALEAVQAYFQTQRNKEEAALKRLIDSLQGGVTFFRAGGGSSSYCGGSTTQHRPQQQQEFPLAISHVDEIVSLAHLEAIRADREAKGALTALLTEARMSLQSLRQRLGLVEEGREVAQRRAAQRRGDVLQADVERWREAVVPHLKRPGVTHVGVLLKAVKLFRSHASTSPEMHSIATVLEMQLHLVTLNRLIKQLSRPDHHNLDSGGDSNDQGRGSGASGASGSGGGGGGGGGGWGPVRKGESPDLGHMLPSEVALWPRSSARLTTGAETRVASSAAAGGAGDDDNGGRSGGGEPTTIVARHGGDLPAVLREALAAVVLSLSSFKTICRAGGNALWVQPCPLLNCPRVAAPGLLIACSALESLGFGDTAAQLRLEAGFPDAARLAEMARSMNSRRKTLKDGGGGAGASGHVGSGQAVKSSSKAKATSKGNSAPRETLSAGSVGVVEGVDDALLIEYDKITGNSSSLELRPQPLGISLVRFQLRCMGDRLERLATEMPDPRVGFIPDAWQRRLLDIVDAASSAVVCAPTSSGKTFITSYVVRKVLDEHGGHGRVILVVPTKVLVLQIQAQIAKDFHNVRNLPDGIVVQGTFTRDFRQHMLNCVALVTVPQCLEILLLSPAHREWVASLKYIIFDEVQCIAEHDGGEFWERSLLGTRCPFLALSATIGNPEVFTDWLRRVKERQRMHDEAAAAGGAPPSATGSRVRTMLKQHRQSPRSTAVYDVHLIVHKERFNDLTGYLFLPSLESVWASAAPEDSDKENDDAAAMENWSLLHGDVDGGEVDELMPYGPGPADVAAAAAVRQAAARRKTAELPPAVQRVAGTEGAGVDRYVGSILPLHPLISVDLNRVAHTGKLPAELSMTPGELLQLYDGLAWQAATFTAAMDAMEADDGDDGQRATLRKAAEAVRQRLTALDPERIFAPLNPASMPALGLQPGTPSTARAVEGSSLVIRNLVKSWEKLLMQEALTWACAPPVPIPVSATAAAPGTDDEPNSGPRPVEGARWADAAAGPSVGPQASCDAVQQLYGPWKACLRAIVHELSAGVYPPHDAVQQAWAAAQDGELPTSTTFLHTFLPSLIRTLHRQQKLPAILFNFSRHGMEQLARTIVRHLEAVQKRYRERYAAQLAYERAARGVTDASRQQSGSSDDDPDPDEAYTAAALAKLRPVLDGLTFSLDPQRPDPSFSLIPFEHVDDERLLNELKRLRNDDRVNPDLVRALEFGVGVHHGGLNKHYRQAVEMLFRAKILQVVIAAGTLALGVHMPCRTVVMVGDSSHLDALNYRQMSGRSGRRGLDTLGHVVFYGLPLHRVHRLRTAPIPHLHGQMLVTPSTTLRLLLLDEQLRLGKATSISTSAGGDSLGGPAVDLTLKMLSEPFLATAASVPATAAAAADATATLAGQHGATRRSLMRHTLGFSLVCLLRSRMIDPATGRLQGLAGMATHLFWTEPSNLVLCRLIHAGVFVRMCKQLRGQTLKNRTMALLANIFLRKPLSPGLAARVRVGAFSGTTSSVVELPPMDPEAAAVVNQYNQESFAAAVGYVLDFALREQQRRQAEAGSASCGMNDDTLPYSGVSVKPAAAATTIPASAAGAAADLTVGSGGLVWLLARMQRHLVACSPFMALGGQGDDFRSMAEMLACVRHGIELQSKAIPVLERYNRQGLEQPLNAWMYDFFKVPSVKALCRDNQIREGDVWDMLKSAEGVLYAIATAIEVAAEAATAAASARQGESEDGAVAPDEEEMAEELGGDHNYQHKVAPGGTGGDGSGSATGVDVLDAELQPLQGQPLTALRNVQIVAKLFRAVAQEFGAGTRRVGA